MQELPGDKAATEILEGRAVTGLCTDVLNLSLAEVKKGIPAIPAGLRCYSLSLKGQNIEALPADLQVEYKLDLTDCHHLRELPEGLKVSSLVLTNCSSLAALPAGLQVNFLQIDGCTALREWPEGTTVIHGWVRARGCSSLEKLPDHLGPITSLDLRNCRRIASVPPTTRISSWIDIGGTRIDSLPEDLCAVTLRWRGVPVSAQIAFFPETLNGAEIIAEKNTELRRVMIERVGFEKFVREVHAETIDSDRDRGGERKLLRVPLKDDEPIVLVSVHCPSTGRQYLIRVPPATRTCHQAVAWTAGFDNPADYAPIAET